MGILSKLVNRKSTSDTVNYNRVFNRQIRKIFGINPVIPPDFEELFLKVSQTYDDFQKDRVFLQNTTDISIKELRQINESFQKSKEELTSTKTELEESQKLAALSKELQEANENLKQKQEEVAKAYDELKGTQNQLILSEKMASLGQLTAGVAHEINTPLSVINGSITNLNDSLVSIIKDMPDFFKKLSQDHESTFLKMVNRSAENTKGETSTKEEREIRKKITDTLNEKGIDNARSIARNLVRVGLHDNVEEFIPLFGNDDADHTVDMVLRIGRLQSNVNNMATAVTKMQKIVFSLKNYSHFQADDEAIESDLIEGLETVLTLYDNKMKEGVNIVRNFEEKKLPVSCFPDQLDQVWTNLIHNAAQAMKYQGTLTLDAKYEDDNAVVMVSDTGPGIPHNILPKIFEPFFTTKAQGEGSGLGLSICKKIVDKHGGKLEIETKPGKTTFKVSIPKEGIVVEKE